MKNLITIFFIILSSSAFAQNIPIDSITGKVSYTGVVNVDSLKKEIIYSKAREWFVLTFKSADDVLQMEDKESGKLIGKAYQDIIIKSLVPITTRMYYTIKINIKDYKYRYEITNINYQSYPTPQMASYTTFPEDWFIPREKIYKKNGEPKSINKSYLEETNNGVRELMNNLKSHMAKKGIIEKSDW